VLYFEIRWRYSFCFQ